jgi:hypothetical protein
MRLGVMGSPRRSLFAWSPAEKSPEYRRIEGRQRYLERAPAPMTKSAIGCPVQAQEATT